MTLYLVRHAKAQSRGEWEREERQRPLTAGGHRQAVRLLETLRGAEVTRIVSSPYLRCRQTLEPLAAQRGLALELDDRLAEGASLQGALELLEGLGSGHVVLCGHGDLIPRLVSHLCGKGRRAGPLFCEKGSVWVVEDGPAGSARYLPPPARGSGDAPSSELRRARRAAASGDVAEPGGAKERIAVLDLGSTSFHLLVADATPFGQIERVVAERSMLRLGALLAGSPSIPDDVARRAVDTAGSLCDVASAAGAARLLPVATAALREAENGPELASRIGERVAAPVRVLSGAEEARLMFSAFRHRVSLPEGSSLGIDLGGGSLELAVGDADGLHWETTLPLGVARLCGELVRGDPLSKASKRAVRQRVLQQAGAPRREISRWRPEACVATGGTVGALARLIVARRTSWPRRAVSQVFVPRAELDELVQELVESTHEERLRMRGMARPRVDLLPTGALVLATLAEALDLDGFTVSDWGLREGVILEALGAAYAGPGRASA